MSGMEQEYLFEHLISCTELSSTSYFVLYSIVKNGSECPLVADIISLVLGLSNPPISTIPWSVCQLECSILACSNVLVVTQSPEEKVMQVWRKSFLSFPPQMVRLSMVWPNLSWGAGGKEQVWLEEGLKYSTLIPEAGPLPPETTIPKNIKYYHLVVLGDNKER